MKAILISPGFGSGWSTSVWPMDTGGDLKAAKIFALTYRPLILAVMGGGDRMPAMRQFADEFAERFPEMSGPLTDPRNADDLRVVFVDDNRPFIVEEYDGNEGLRFRDTTPWIDPADLNLTPA